MSFVRLLLVVVLLSLAAPASAQTSQPLTDGLNFSVGLAPDPVPVKAGDVVIKNVAVTNGSTVAETYAVSVISVDVGDEGVVTPAEQRTDEIVKAITVSPQVTVEPGTTADVPLIITAPQELDPDIYFVGVLVQPANVAPNAGGQITINRLLNVLAVDVFGTQNRGVEIAFPNHSWFHVNSINEDYTITNRNAGVSVSRQVSLEGFFTDQNLSPQSEESTQRTSLDTIARGHKKTFDYDYNAGLFTVDVVRPTVSVTFSDAGTERTLTEAGPRTLLVSPLALGLVGVILLLLVVGVVVIVRRRRKRVAGNGDNKAEDSPTAD